jgi:tetratricopeptide (TPR) repeat protein
LTFLRRRFFAGSILLLLFPVLLKAQSIDSTASIAQLILEGDSLAEKFYENEKALEKYSEALSRDTLNDEILWRMSRAYLVRGEQLPSATDEQKEAKFHTYEQAAAYAERAISLNPSNSMGYAQRAAASIEIALFKNIWKYAGLMNSVRDDCEKAIELDEHNALAYAILGRAHLRLSERMKIFRWPFGVAWGNRNDAIRLFEKAISLQPTSISYRYDAARACIENKEYEKAREHLSVISGIPTATPSDERLRREAADLLEQVRKK